MEYQNLPKNPKLVDQPIALVRSASGVQSPESREFKFNIEGAKQSQNSDLRDALENAKRVRDRAYQDLKNLNIKNAERNIQEISEYYKKIINSKYNNPERLSKNDEAFIKLVFGFYWEQVVESIQKVKNSRGLTSYELEKITKDEKSVNTLRQEALQVLEKNGYGDLIEKYKKPNKT